MEDVKVWSRCNNGCVFSNVFLDNQRLEVGGICDSRGCEHLDTHVHRENIYWNGGYSSEDREDIFRAREREDRYNRV